MERPKSVKLTKLDKIEKKTSEVEPSELSPKKRSKSTSSKIKGTSRKDKEKEKEKNVEKLELSPEEESIVEEFIRYAWDNQIDELKQLLPKVQELKLINALNIRGQSALYCACRNGHNRIVVELLNSDRIDPNVRTIPQLSTPLHVAAANKKRETLALLLTSNADKTLTNNANQKPIDGADPSIVEIFNLFNDGVIVRNCEQLVSEFPVLTELKYTQIVLKKVEMVKQKALQKQQEQEAEASKAERLEDATFQFANKKAYERVVVDYQKLSQPELDEHIMGLGLSKLSYTFAHDFTDTNNFLNYFNNPSFAAQNNKTVIPESVINQNEPKNLSEDHDLFKKIDNLIFKDAKNIETPSNSQFSQNGVLESMGFDPLYFDDSVYVVQEKAADKTGIFSAQATALFASSAPKSNRIRVK